ncbi:MAG: recombinase family protein, partial [Candidatus Dormibacteraeota bacterium]|nr:recombinase family protein [Candidatus Dormibacteraeota bacterium]
MVTITLTYARISDDREKTSVGVERQLKDLRARVEHEGWMFEPTDEFRDDNISAFSGKVRPGYEAMMARVRAIVADGDRARILVYHQDRLYRRQDELTDLIKLAKRGHIEIVSLTGGQLDLGNSDGRMVATMLTAVGSKASEDTSRRV